MRVTEEISYVRWCWWFLCEEFGVSKNCPYLVKGGLDFLKIGQYGYFFSSNGDINGVGATYLLILV